MTRVQEESHKTDPERTTASPLANPVTSNTHHLTAVRHPDRDQDPDMILSSGMNQEADPNLETAPETQVQTQLTPEPAPNPQTVSRPR